MPTSSTYLRRRGHDEHAAAHHDPLRGGRLVHALHGQQISSHAVEESKLQEAFRTNGSHHKKGEGIVRQRVSRRKPMGKRRGEKILRYCNTLALLVLELIADAHRFVRDHTAAHGIREPAVFENGGCLQPVSSDGGRDGRTVQERLRTNKLNELVPRHNFDRFVRRKKGYTVII